MHHLVRADELLALLLEPKRNTCYCFCIYRLSRARPAVGAWSGARPRLPYACFIRVLHLGTAGSYAPYWVRLSLFRLAASALEVSNATRHSPKRPFPELLVPPFTSNGVLYRYRLQSATTHCMEVSRFLASNVGPTSHPTWLAGHQKVSRHPIGCGTPARVCQPRRDLILPDLFWIRLSPLVLPLGTDSSKKPRLPT